jgi:hypothetical protein
MGEQVGGEVMALAQLRWRAVAAGQVVDQRQANGVAQRGMYGHSLLERERGGWTTSRHSASVEVSLGSLNIG